MVGRDGELPTPEQECSLCRLVEEEYEKENNSKYWKNLKKICDGDG